MIFQNNEAIYSIKTFMAAKKEYRLKKYLISQKDTT